MISKLRAALATAVITGLLRGCDQPPREVSRPTPVAPLPTSADVQPSNTSDTSCTCFEGGDCANIADAVYGQSEVRALSCRAGEGAGIAECNFETRFINLEHGDPIPSPWTAERGHFKRLANGRWCGA